MTAQIKHLIQLQEYLQEIENEGTHVRIKYTVINTGLVQCPPTPDNLGWKEWVNLGGRHIMVDIQIPNRRTLIDAIENARKNETNQDPKTTNDIDQ